MKKAMLIIVSVIILLSISIMIGYYIYKAEIAGQQDLAANTLDENIVKEERDFTIQQANTQEEKVTPNTQFILQKHYETCGHTTMDYVEIPSKIVNMNKEEVQEEYEDWEIKEFSKEQVVLAKNEDGTCEQHYILREKDGYIAIYWIEQDGTESLKEVTGIATEYLTENDLMEINEGICVYGLQELNSKIEDYE